jgi:hypothetical protein
MAEDLLAQKSKNQYRSNFDLNDPFSLNFVNDPDVGSRSILQRRGRYDLTNPFTRHLLDTFGQKGVLGETLNWFAPAGALRDAKSTAETADQLFNSFYEPGAAAPYGMNLGDRAGTGRRIVGMLTGQGEGSDSLMRQSYLQGMTSGEVRGAIENLLQISAPFTMSSLQVNLAMAELRDLEVDYWASGAYSSGQQFGQYLLAKGADWLQRWWQMEGGNLPNADAARVTRPGAMTTQQADENRAAYEAQLAAEEARRIEEARRRRLAPAPYDQSGDITSTTNPF